MSSSHNFLFDKLKGSAVIGSKLPRNSANPSAHQTMRTIWPTQGMEFRMELVMSLMNRCGL